MILCWEFVYTLRHYNALFDVCIAGFAQSLKNYGEVLKFRLENTRSLKFIEKEEILKARRVAAERRLNPRGEVVNTVCARPD